MNYEWDDHKNKINIEKHALDFCNSPFIFKASVIIIEDTRKEYGETRMIGIGILKNRFMVVVFTENEEKDRRRIVSLRKATKNERTIYENFFQD